MTKVSGETRLTSSPIALASAITPVEVSTWVKVISLNLSFLSAASISSSPGRPPTGAPSWVTAAPYAARQSPNSVPK